MTRPPRNTLWKLRLVFAASVTELVGFLILGGKALAMGIPT